MQARVGWRKEYLTLLRSHSAGRDVIATWIPFTIPDEQRQSMADAWGRLTTAGVSMDNTHDLPMRCRTAHALHSESPVISSAAPRPRRVGRGASRNHRWRCTGVSKGSGCALRQAIPDFIARAVLRPIRPTWPGALTIPMDVQEQESRRRGDVLPASEYRAEDTPCSRKFIHRRRTLPRRNDRSSSLRTASYATPWRSAAIIELTQMRGSPRTWRGPVSDDQPLCLVFGVV